MVVKMRLRPGLLPGRLPAGGNIGGSSDALRATGYCQQHRPLEKCGSASVSHHAWLRQQYHLSCVHLDWRLSIFYTRVNCLVLSVITPTCVAASYHALENNTTPPPFFFSPLVAEAHILRYHGNVLITPSNATSAIALAGNALKKHGKKPLQ